MVYTQRGNTLEMPQDAMNGAPMEHIKENSHKDTPYIPASIWEQSILPFVNDRATWNSVTSTCKELYETTLDVDRPWPCNEVIIRNTLKDEGGHGFPTSSCQIHTMAEDRQVLKLEKKTSECVVIDRNSGIRTLSSNLAETRILACSPRESYVVSTSRNHSTSLEILEVAEFPKKFARSSVSQVFSSSDSWQWEEKAASWCPSGEFIVSIAHRLRQVNEDDPERDERSVIGLRLWEAATGQLVKATIEWQGTQWYGFGPEDSWDIHFHPHGEFLIIEHSSPKNMEQRRLFVWQNLLDPTDTTSVPRYLGLHGKVYEFSPDGQYLAVATLFQGHSFAFQLQLFTVSVLDEVFFSLAQTFSGFCEPTYRDAKPDTHLHLSFAKDSNYILVARDVNRYQGFRLDMLPLSPDCVPFALLADNRSYQLEGIKVIYDHTRSLAGTGVVVVAYSNEEGEERVEFLPLDYEDCSTGH